MLLIIYQRTIVRKGGERGEQGTQPNGLACEKVKVVFLKVLHHNKNSSFCKKTFVLNYTFF